MSKKETNPEIKKAKKKINRYVAFTSLAAILLVAIIGFAMSYQQVGAQFQYEMRDVPDVILNNLEEDTNTWNDANIMSAFFSILQGHHVNAGDYSFPKYPMVVGFYSADTGELIHKSGSMLSVGYDQTLIDLEPYLTDNVVEKLRKYHMPGFEFGELYYYRKDGEIIPVKIRVHTFIAEDHITAGSGDVVTINIDSSDLRPGDTINLSDEDGPISSANAIDYFIDDKEGSKDYKLYQELHSVIESQELKSDVDFLDYYARAWITVGGAHYTTGYDMSLSDNRRFYYVSPCMFVDGELGFFRVVAGHNIVREALTNTTFLYPLIGTVLTILGIALIAQAILKKVSVKRIVLEESQRAFVSGAAHELKTPLSIIQNQAECILENVAPEKNRKYIESIYEEAQRMDNMVKTIQEYDRLGADAKIGNEKFDLLTTLNVEIDKYRPSFESKGISLELQLPTDEIKMTGDENLIALAIDNYLSNAVKYTEAGGHVKVSLTDTNSGNKLSVFNSCEGLSDDDIIHVWDMLYKTDSARERDGDSSGGMGLPICKRIFELHGIKYGCKNHDGGVEFFFYI